MALFRCEDHADNGPETWRVETVRDASGRRVPSLFHLTTAGGDVLDTFTTRREAEAAKESGHLVTLYHRERRWYAGEEIPGWRPWAEVHAEQERREAWLAQRAEANR